MLQKSRSKSDRNAVVGLIDWLITREETSRSCVVGGARIEERHLRMLHLSHFVLVLKCEI